MPKQKKSKSILIIGSGPIVIGQAAEFDYAGTQGVLALKNAGYRVILVNSNPATIMTDPGIADATYIEPLTKDVVEHIIDKERPDALLATLGGQAGLNLALQITKKIRLLGVSKRSIQIAEDRTLFHKTVKKLGLDLPKSYPTKEKAHFPALIRSSFSLGGLHGKIAYSASDCPDGCTLTEALIGWKEFELELVRDKNDNCIVVGALENIDPLGIHTGDSITCCPILTLTDKEYQMMRNQAFSLMRALKIVGGANVQFALDPKSGRCVVIEMNPRVSRSSALVSKATGYPIAKISALLAVGYTLDELSLQNIPAAFEPVLDYVVVKIPKFQFEKFPETVDLLGPKMQSVGEVMAIGRTFSEALIKAMRSVEIGTIGPFRLKPHSARLWHIFDAFKAGMTVQEVHSETAIDPWFLEEIKTCQLHKATGFKHIDSTSAEFATTTSYAYSTSERHSEGYRSRRKKIMVLGSGPCRIGQSIEFDYSATHAIFALKALGYETIMVNCNPETVSTDPEVADKLYISPITMEDLTPILELEKPDGIIVQFGGQTPLLLAKELTPLLGITYEAIERTENRAHFRAFIHSLGLKMPEEATTGPRLFRPSFSLGGHKISRHTGDYAERFLENAIEVDIDAITDGKTVFIPAIMEQIEPAGTHSGDSASVIPPIRLSQTIQNELKRQTEVIALALNIKGLFNIQFAIENGTIYVLEVNPRASRSVPFVSKATGIYLVKIATEVLVGMPLTIPPTTANTHFFVKEAVLPHAHFSCISPSPEMQSTGEVMGKGLSFMEAYQNAQLAAGYRAKGGMSPNYD